MAMASLGGKIDEDDTTQVLYEASLRGNIATLEKLIQNDPFILDKVFLTSSSRTPLHISAVLGHLGFTETLLARKPELVIKLDSHQSSPLHLASAEGHTEIVKALLDVNKDIAMLRDQDGKIPLHHAVINGKFEVVQALTKARPDSITRVRFHNGETVLHLCVKNNHLEILKLLVEFTSGDEQFLNMEGGDGKNTIFDLAVMLNHGETIRYLASVPKVRLGASAMTRIGLTPSDGSIHDSRLGKESGKYSNNNGLKDMRNALMIVATVIATMTFQPAMNPPGGVWQSNINESTPGFFCGPGNHTCLAGTAVLSYLLSPPEQLPDFPDKEQWNLFLFFNSMSFLASVSVILLLISGVSLRNKVYMWLLTIAMCVTLTFLVLSYMIIVVLVNCSNYTVSVLKIYQASLYVWFGLAAIILVYYSTRISSWIAGKVKKLTSKAPTGASEVETLPGLVLEIEPERHFDQRRFNHSVQSLEKSRSGYRKRVVSPNYGQNKLSKVPPS